MCAERSASVYWKEKERTIILDESPDSGQTTQGSACLVSVQDTKLGETERKLFVTPFSGVENESVTGTVHWLDGELLLIDLKLEHVFRVVLPVARGLPEFRVEDVWRAD
jgi:hypothetical protein